MIVKRLGNTGLHETIIHVQGISDIYYCFGDGNVDFMNTEGLYTRKFNELLYEVSSTQLIDCPTRITPESNTLIDFIITNNSDTSGDSGTIPADIADHEVIYCEILCPKPSTQPVIKTFRNFKNINKLDLLRDLDSLPLHFMFRISLVDEKVQFLTDQIRLLMDIHAPVKTARFSKPYTPWLTDTVRLMIKLRNNALSRFKATRQPHHWNYYKSLRNLTTSAVRYEKKAYINTALTQTNSRELWRVCGRLILLIKVNKPLTLISAISIKTINITVVTWKNLISLMWVSTQ